MVKRAFQMNRSNWFISLMLLCASAAHAVEVDIYGLSSTSVRISRECIDADVNTDKDSVSVKIYTKTNAIGKLSLEKESLTNIYERAFKEKDEMEAFMGPVTEILVVESDSKKSFKVSIEDSGKRYQISRMEPFGDSQYVQSSSSYISRFPYFLKALQGLNLPQATQGSQPPAPGK
jgi:hypothetical protein